MIKLIWDLKTKFNNEIETLKTTEFKMKVEFKKCNILIRELRGKPYKYNEPSKN